MVNNAPAAYQAQGAVLDAWAAQHGKQDFARVLEENILRRLGVAYEGDRPLPPDPTPGEWRFHARRHMVRSLGWGPSARTPLPAAGNEALYARWYSPPVSRTWFRA